MPSEKEMLKSEAIDHLAKAKEKLNRVNPTYADLCGIGLHIDQAKTAVNCLQDFRIYKELEIEKGAVL